MVCSDVRTVIRARTVLTDWELWACANQQIARFGDMAAVYAAMRADQLLDAGDLAGHRTWTSILHRINELQRLPHNDTAH